jgi:hypothetical protein
MLKKLTPGDKANYRLALRRPALFDDVIGTAAAACSMEVLYDPFAGTSLRGTSGGFDRRQQAENGRAQSTSCVHRSGGRSANQ